MGSSKKRRQDRHPPAASRAGEVATVAWMVSVMTTTVCGAVAAVVLAAAGDAGGPQVFGRLLHFSAFVSAVVSLVLLGVVLKLRRERPPPAIIGFAVVVALVTIAAGFLY